ncbi:DUF3013 family protein [Streptococcus sp. zg-JUN1979]|uniref:DUF3013 family protein n=1 Tax=Streptococcus sp. zg-JUN1979 TaxID=3391450 RepID=UPI0039A57381
MAAFGFLSVLEEEMDKVFEYDYEINWDKKNHAVELSFILEVGIEDDVVALEEFILFYNPSKSHFAKDDYLVAFPYEQKKGFSREFLAYLATTLNDLAQEGISDIIDFLEDETAEEFTLVWDEATFEQGRSKLVETDFYPYPRY